MLFWTNEGLRVAPSRVRSYGFCNQMRTMGVDASVLSFWDDLAGYKGLPPFGISLARRTYLLFQAMMAAVHNGAGIIVAQRPFYEFLPLISLKVMYPFTLTVWADIDDWIFDYSLDMSSPSVTYRDTLHFHIPVTKGCIVASRHLEKEMRKYFSRVETIPTFPDIQAFKPLREPWPADHAGRIVFSWIGTLLMETVVEDILFLVRVFDSLGDERVVFEVVGDGRYLEPIRTRASRLATTEVVFKGWMDPAAVPDYIATIDVGLYCLTARNDFNMSRSPTKLFEYMACGKPTVSTEYGEAGGFIEHGETGLLAKDFEEFARCCALLANDSSLRSRIGLNARKKIEEEYNMAAGVRKLKAVILDR